MTTLTIKHETIVDLLKHRANSKGSFKLAFSFLQDGKIQKNITFFELDNQARAIASHLQKISKVGDRVLIVCPAGLDYIVSFLGCLYAGLIAVPSIPPSNARSMPQMQAIIDDCDPHIALTTTDIGEQIAKFRKLDATSSNEKFSWINVNEITDIAENETLPSLSSEDIAFLQYTSGSTGSPKGVMVSHGNLLANVGFIHEMLNGSEDDTIVSWLPLYHDMGLIGKMLYPIYAGSHCVQFSPVDFLKRPYRWLKAVSDFKARMTCAPNFAYELCVKKISVEEKLTLDLSSLEFALNGAEPIRANTLNDFAEYFETCGLDNRALTPVYGLAEATLIVSANVQKNSNELPLSLTISKKSLASNDIKIVENESDVVEVVSVGSTYSEQQKIYIVDPVSLALQTENKVGEIWINSASVANGYWGKSVNEGSNFFGRLSNHQESFLRTGDLGFIHEGFLYITGRIKDMMIFNGRNIYPQDVEVTIENCDSAFRANGCAVFSVDHHDLQHLVIIQEVEHRQVPVLEELATKLRSEIIEQHGIFDVLAIQLVKAGALSRTSSGKIQRGKCRERFLSNDFAHTWEWHYETHESNDGKDIELRSETEKKLAICWQQILTLDEVQATDNFFHLGGHSLTAMQLTQQIETIFGISIPLSSLFEVPVLREMAKKIDSHLNMASIDENYKRSASLFNVSNTSSQENQIEDEIEI